MQENTKTDTLTVLAHTLGPMGINTWVFGLTVKGMDWVSIPVEMGLFMWGILWITFPREMAPLSMRWEILILVNGNQASRMVEMGSSTSSPPAVRITTESRWISSFRRIKASSIDA